MEEDVEGRRAAVALEGHVIGDPGREPGPLQHRHGGLCAAARGAAAADGRAAAGGWRRRLLGSGVVRGRCPRIDRLVLVSPPPKARADRPQAVRHACVLLCLCGWSFVSRGMARVVVLFELPHDVSDHRHNASTCCGYNGHGTPSLGDRFGSHQCISKLKLVSTTSLFMILATCFVLNRGPKAAL